MKDVNIELIDDHVDNNELQKEVCNEYTLPFVSEYKSGSCMIYFLHYLLYFILYSD